MGKAFVFLVLFIGVLTACTNEDLKELDNGSNVSKYEQLDLLPAYNNAEKLHAHQYENPHERVTSYVYLATGDVEDIIAYYYDFFDQDSWTLIAHGNPNTNHTLIIEKDNIDVNLRIRVSNDPQHEAYDWEISVEITEHLD